VKNNNLFFTEKVGKKLLIFDLENNIYYSLNETATLIYQKYKQKWLPNRILNLLKKYYQGKSSTLEKDILEQVRLFEKYSL